MIGKGRITARRLPRAKPPAYPRNPRPGAGRIRIVAPTKRVSRLLKLTRINEVIEIAEEDAHATHVRTMLLKPTPRLAAPRTAPYSQAAAR